MMENLKVAVVFHEVLMLEGLVKFLGEQSGVDVITLDPLRDDVSAGLTRGSPDVIVVAAADCADGGGRCLLRIMIENPNARIINVDADRDEIRAFEQHRLTVDRFDELVEALREGGRRIGEPL